LIVAAASTDPCHGHGNGPQKFTQVKLRAHPFAPEPSLEMLDRPECAEGLLDRLRNSAGEQNRWFLTFLPSQGRKRLLEFRGDQLFGGQISVEERESTGSDQLLALEDREAR